MCICDADFFRHSAIACCRTKSDESAEEGILGHGLAAIGQRVLLNSGDIDFHM
jgi:hypothetical protein